MIKDRELLYKFAEHIYNNTGSDDALIVQKNIDSFLATLPEEKEESGYIDDNILQSAIDTWGFDAQCEMILEESLELALALQKMKRVRGDKQQKFNNLIDELADVKIMLRQAERLFPIDLINKRVDFKMKRLKDRLNEKII